MTTHSQPEASALDALLNRYPQLNTPQVSRRALLAVGSLLALDLTGCGSSDDDSVASSGGGGGSGGSGNTTPAPTITSFTPSSGSTAGGTLVTITGTDLTNASTVMFGATAASSFTVVSSTQITATAPAHAAGVVTPSIITPGGTAVATANFTYVQLHINGGVVSTWAGQAGTYGTADGTGTGATFYFPSGVAVDTSGNVYVADASSHLIRRITPLGVVSTWAGQAGTHGTADGTGTGATFYEPTSVAVDASGNVYVADSGNNLIRKIDANRVVTTLAGHYSMMGGFTDDTGTAASFNNPAGVAVDASGNLYVADSYNNRIRKIDTNRVVTTLAGNGLSAWTDGNGTAAQFYTPQGIAIDSSGNLYVAESSGNRVRKITMPGAVVTTVAGSTTSNNGTADGTGTAALFYSPYGVAVDPNNGNLYVVERMNSTIRRIDTNRVVSTWAGHAGATGSADGTGTAAFFNTPYGVAVDANSYIYVADTWNETIRKIS